MIGFEEHAGPVPAVVTVERPGGGPPTVAVEVEVEPAGVCPAAGGVYKRAGRAATRLLTGLVVSDGVPDPVRSRLCAITNVLAAGERAERAVTGERTEYEVAFNEPRPDLGRELETIEDAEGWADRLPPPAAEGGRKPKRTFTRDADGMPRRLAPCETDYRLAEVFRLALALTEALQDYERDDPGAACGCPFCEYKDYLTDYLGAASHFLWDVACAAEGDTYHTQAQHAKKLATDDTDRRRIAAILREHARETAAAGE